MESIYKYYYKRITSQPWNESIDICYYLVTLVVSSFRSFFCRTIRQLKLTSARALGKRITSGCPISSWILIVWDLNDVHFLFFRLNLV